MEENNPGSTFASAQQLRTEGLGSRERIFITQIQAEGVAHGLRHFPQGFYVAVEIDGNAVESLNKPPSRGKDEVEWDEEILLPSEQSSVISLSVYASFELGPRLGKGELLGQMKLTVSEVLDRCERLQPARFLVQREGEESTTSCWSLGISTERRTCDSNEYVKTRDQTGSDTTSELARLTDEGHHFLLRHVGDQNQKDLDEAIACFRRADEMCPNDHPNRSTVLCNLARVRLVECRSNDRVDVDVPITLFRSALHLRDSTHPDHSATALCLSSALLDRFQRRHDENDMTEARSLLSRTIELFPDICGVQAVSTILKWAEMSVSKMGSGTSQTNTGDSDDEGLIQKAQSILADLPDSDPERATLLARFAMLLKYRFINSGNVADLQKSVSMAEMAVEITPDGHPEKPARLGVFGSTLGDRFSRFGDLADIHKSVLMLEEAVRLTPNGHPNKPDELDELAISLSRRFERLGDIADVDRSIMMLEEAVTLIPNAHPSKPISLGNLATSLSCRFDHLGEIMDINKSISTHEEAIRLTPNDHPNKPVGLNELANSLSRRFDRLGDIADINRSILMREEAIHLTPDGHPLRVTGLSGLASSLLSRFDHHGDIMDINRSILMAEEAIQLTPDDHPDRLPMLGQLASSLSRRFDHLGDITDINKSILMLEEAIRLTPKGHHRMPTRLDSLANSLSRRFGRLGDIADINKSVSMHKKAIRLTPKGDPNMPIWLGNLANSLSSRFRRFGDIADINKSVSAHEKAVRLAPNDHLQKPTWLGNLAIALSTRFDRLGDIADINRSVTMLEEAVHLTPDGHPNKLLELDQLANSFASRFDHLGDLGDIDKSISMHEEVIRLTPNGHPDMPMRLVNLANSLSRRFRYLSDISDLDKSITTYEEAVCLTPDDHPRKSSRTGNLATLLSSRFVHLGEITDLDKSISMQEEAVRFTPNDHPDKPIGLSELAGTLSKRFVHHGDIADINKSISMHEEAISLISSDNPKRPAGLDAFADSLSVRFDRLGDITDIKRSISFNEESVSLTPNGHFGKIIRLTGLANALMSHYEHSHDPSSLAAATLHSSAAAKSSTGLPSHRFHAAYTWISCMRIARNSQPSLDSQALLEPFTTVITLLPQLAWLGLPVAERHRELITAVGIASDAAAAAIDVGQPAMAVEWLEQGRSVVWNQLLHLRTPADDLRTDHPLLAEQFRITSRELEVLGTRQIINIEYLPSVLDSRSSSLESEMRKHHELALKRDKLVAEIRSLPGFERFLLPKTIEQLSPFARSGPVVYLNASKQRCDALIIKAELHDAILVPLPDISYHELREFHHSLLKGTRSSIVSSDDMPMLISSGGEPLSRRLLGMVMERDPSDGRDGGLVNEEHSVCLESSLKTLWISVIKPVLKALGFSTPPSGSEKLPRIFWCPTGPFSFLPIHAAGRYGSRANSGPGNKLSDFAISSYIPTISALAPSVEKNMNNPRSPPSHLRVVTVPQPSNDDPKLARLHGVKEELDHIGQLSNSSPFVTLQSSDGTIEDVMEKMKVSDWVHFACHGVQDRERALDSGLCLANKRRLKLSDIIRLTRPQGGLAFLSACQTAKGDEKLPEESVHLAAGLLLAGYSGVIATMWSIMDHDAPQVTKDVYEHLFRDGKVPDPLEAAEALHYAVQRLRDSGVAFSSWVPFIHVGR